MRERIRIQVEVVGYSSNEPSEWIKCTFKDYYNISWEITLKDCDVSGNWERENLQFPEIGYLHGYIINQIKEGGKTIYEFDADVMASHEFNGEIIYSRFFKISEGNVLS